MNKRRGKEERREGEKRKKILYILEKEKIEAEWREGHVYGKISKCISIEKILISANLNVFSVGGNEALKNISACRGLFIFQLVQDYLILFGIRKGKTSIN